MGRPNVALVEKQAAEGFVTVPEAARITSVSERGIRTWTRTGRVDVRRVGGLVFVNVDSLRRVAGMEAAS